jgi:hypothetical protein
MTIIYLDADITVAEPVHESQRNDLNTWMPGTAVGETPDSTRCSTVAAEPLRWREVAEVPPTPRRLTVSRLGPLGESRLDAPGTDAQIRAGRWRSGTQAGEGARVPARSQPRRISSM